ncbi:MAG TPA: hypothetical protein V6C96_04305 [Vampirovibrionales bacterium]
MVEWFNTFGRFNGYCSDAIGGIGKSSSGEPWARREALNLLRPDLRDPNTNPTSYQLSAGNGLKMKNWVI